MRLNANIRSRRWQDGGGFLSQSYLNAINAQGDISSTSNILTNDDGTVFGVDTTTAQGTSFAAPIVSGVVSLMLEANPNLGWRDIQQILAMTARKVNDTNTDTVWNGATNWNGGGMHTSHDYGFGDVDARAAVRLAETWSVQHVSANERHLGSVSWGMGIDKCYQHMSRHNSIHGKTVSCTNAVWRHTA